MSRAISQSDMPSAVAAPVVRPASPRQFLNAAPVVSARSASFTGAQFAFPASLTGLSGSPTPTLSQGTGGAPSLAAQVPVASAHGPSLPAVFSVPALPVATAGISTLAVPVALAQGPAFASSMPAGNQVAPVGAVTSVTTAVPVPTAGQPFALFPTAQQPNSRLVPAPCEWNPDSSGGP